MFSIHSRRAAAFALAAALTVTGLGFARAVAVNSDHGARVVSTNPANSTPHVMDGSVNAITQVGSRVIAAGTFTRVSPPSTFSDTSDDVVRNGIFAFNATTGAIDAGFNPNLGGAANSVDTDGTSVYVAGSFGSVAGNAAMKRVVKLTAAGAVVSSFRAVPNQAVNEVVVRGSRVYVGGGFTNVRSGTVTTGRNALAALDASTGAVLSSVSIPFTGVYDSAIGGTTNIKRFDVNRSGTKLAAIGNFSSVGGLQRSQVAVLDTPTTGPAKVSSWSTNRFDAAHNDCSTSFATFVRDVDFSPDGSYFVVSSTGAFAGGAGSGTLCDTVTRWETNSSAGTEPSWLDYTGGDTTYGVAVTGSTVYVGGHMRWENNPAQGDQAGPGAVPRQGIAALDPVNGLPMSWNPGRDRGVGAQALFATSTGLWVGSDTTRIGGETHARLAFMPLSGGKSVAGVPAAALPNDIFAAQSTSLGVLLRRAVSATGVPTAAASTANTSMDWSAVRGAFLVTGVLFYGLSDGSLYARTFDRATGAVGTQQTVNLYDDPDTGQRIPFPIANVSGMFYDTATHRIYYGVVGDSNLYYRYFTPESRVVGAQTFTANRNGVAFDAVAGMTLAGGWILYGSTADGNLRSVAFAGGQVTGTPTVVSSDGTWRYRAMFVPES